MRRLLLFCACLPLAVAAQNFNPHKSDSTSNKEVPKRLYVWTVDRHFGDIRRAEPDTLPHLYPQSTLGMGRQGEYNTVGSNYTARQNRIFTDRKETGNFLLTDAYDQSLRRPDEWHFTNTLSPITNLSYDNCGDKTNGEDHVNAFFAVNAGKKTGIGFNLDYQYARGYFQNQSTSHFGATIYGSHLGDRYQLHFLYTNNHQKATENGGIVSDGYITHPERFTESYSENEIPTVLERNWNRNNSHHIFLTHRYSVGFYRKVPMTEEEKEARKFALQSQKEKLEREAAEREQQLLDDGEENSQEEAGQGMTLTSLQPDSLQSLGATPVDSADLWMKSEYVPVTSFIHTLEANLHDRVYQAYASPRGLYADTLYNICANGSYSGDSIYDQTKMAHLRNTFAVALLEGFNKYAPAGLKAFASYELRRYDMPDLLATGSTSLPSSMLNRWTEHNVSLGGQLQKAQGRAVHYNLLAEAWVAGEDAGALKLDATADLNFPLFGDTVTLAAKAWLHRLNPSFYQRHYHSKHLWWDNDFSRETRTHIEGALTLPRTKTSLRVAVDEIQKYTYLGMDYTIADGQENRLNLTAAFRQHSGNLSVLTAQLVQPLSLGPLNWDNIITYQASSNKDVLPLPTLNVFSNLYLQFMVAHVLRVELGASATWFTKYYAPDYLPQLNSFAVQQNATSRMELGNFPFIDVYANLHLKHARFFVMMANATATSFNRQAFLVPHHPLNRAVLHMGVSWNFFN